ncbi:hypothetical protein J6590_014668 [Homalodisca vitripennis]|nr:hypothetical protein J6590_014668 [Homalodisca vitripennis]
MDTDSEDSVTLRRVYSVHMDTDSEDSVTLLHMDTDSEDSVTLRDLCTQSTWTRTARILSHCVTCVLSPSWTRTGDSVTLRDAGVLSPHGHGQRGFCHTA